MESGCNELRVEGCCSSFGEKLWRLGLGAGGGDGRSIWIWDMFSRKNRWGRVIDLM